MRALSVRAPWEFPRRVLLAAAGLSPQVVTETLYALAVQREPPFVPTEVHLLTTAEGAERARLNLLGEEPGWFARLCGEYGLTGIRFDEECLHTIGAGDGDSLGDIRSGEDNERTADFIMSELRHFTSDADAAIHVSLAGGRKTMGFYLGYSLSLLGRPQDRLSHVLVSPPFESHPGFYYPTRARQVIHTPMPDSRPLDTSKAVVTLAEIPFVRLRDWVPEALLRRGDSFAGMVGAAQDELGVRELKIDYARREVTAAGARLTLAPAELAFLGWMARRKREGKAPVACPSEGVRESGHAVEYLAEYSRILGEMGSDERTAEALEGGMEKWFFLEHKSRLHRALRRALGVRSRGYEIKAVGRRPDTRYEAGLEPEEIEWMD